ncbi:hypothetical protein HJFPF1_03890 [Paramyrothecium foliicola]|nr:hypothetical protein HJFPF1_03890 [Paramyrothecium foliicola]
MRKVHSSRRAVGLKPGDYDHEINLIDHEGTVSGRRTTELAEADNLERADSSSRLRPSNGDAQPRPPSHGDEDSFQIQERPAAELEEEQELPQGALRPSIEVQTPTPAPLNQADNQRKPIKQRKERESSIDILYENERGGFLCGTALFSAKALGGLDVPPWTNKYHKPSPTDINTAQVPDPTWEWVWPEWRINHQEGMDEHGWEYSFAFTKKNKFSWHGPTWWNSFVRRRAWVRKRAKKNPDDVSADPHMLNTDYFTVRPASETKRLSQASLAASLAPSKASNASNTRASSIAVTEEEKVDIEDVETLLRILKAARIDREKLEAVENYLEHATDLAQLHHEMHDVMSLFVFQASRKILLSRLTQIYDETNHELEKKSYDEHLKQRKEALENAIKHADEETRKLAYWSDIKQMAEDGETQGAVDGGKGWDGDAWQGVDQSGPTEPNNGELPGKK